VSSSAPNFNTRELGQLIIGLQRACALCEKQHKKCVVHHAKEACPVERARAAVGQYLYSGTQADPKLDLKAIPNCPSEVVVDTALLEEVLAKVPGLCNRCMFHMPHCFMNVFYRSLELALGRDPKPLEVRPGDLLKAPPGP
jgi:hypothetical protein